MPDRVYAADAEEAVRQLFDEALRALPAIDETQAQSNFAHTYPSASAAGAKLITGSEGEIRQTALRILKRLHGKLSVEVDTFSSRNYAMVALFDGGRAGPA